MCNIQVLGKPAFLPYLMIHCLKIEALLTKTQLLNLSVSIANFSVFIITVPAS
jgi:hypothetical protein